jgi:hypothetical protein
MYAERKPPEEPPCYDCRIDPFYENKDAVNVFFTVRYQFISDSMGPIDINHQAIDLAMQRKGITDNTCFDKVVSLSRWWIDKIRKKDAS